MESGTQPKEASPGYWIGWCVLGAAITQLPIIIGAFAGMRISTGLGGALLTYFLPTVLMLLLGSVGLIRRQFYGYWCTYLATFFGGLGGLKTSYVPFIQRWLNLGPQTGDVFLVLNLIIVSVLAWEHFLRLDELELGRQRLHRVTMVCILLAGFGSVAFGRAMEDHERGEAPTTGAIPIIGKQLASLKTDGPVRYVYVHTKLMKGMDLVFSGKTTEDNLRALVEAQGLKQLDKPETYPKILPRTRKWKLDTDRFPTQFAPPDLLFIGRLKSGDKAILQIAWRKSDSRFTGELMGTVLE